VRLSSCISSHGTLRRLQPPTADHLPSTALLACGALWVLTNPLQVTSAGLVRIYCSAADWLDWVGSFWQSNGLYREQRRMVKNRRGSNFLSWNPKSWDHAVRVRLMGFASLHLVRWRRQTLDYIPTMLLFTTNWKAHSTEKAASLIELFVSPLKQQRFLVFPRGLLCQLPSPSVWCSSVFVIRVFVLSLDAIVCQILLFLFHLWNTYLLRETQQTRQWFEGELLTAVSTYLICDSCT